LTEQQGGFELVIDSVSKSFGARHVLRSVGARAQTGQVMVVAGPNGSGKSTLIKLAARIVRPTEGRVLWKLDGRELSTADTRRVVGLVSPDLNFYDELSAIENLRFFARVRGVGTTDSAAKGAIDGTDSAAKGAISSTATKAATRTGSRESAESLLDRFQLAGRGDDLVGAYSSGMKQRLKYAFALMHNPPLLLLDEPTANLDERGIALVRDTIAQAGASKCVVIATNEPEEVRLGDILIQLRA
jgi:heme exporter protein A